MNTKIEIEAKKDSPLVEEFSFPTRKLNLTKAVSPKLKLKTILITGVSSGLGYECLINYAENNYDVWGTVTNINKVPEIPVHLKNRIHFLELDVTKEESIVKAVKQFKEATGGKIDILVNNAGQMWNTVIGEISHTDVMKLFQVNYFGQVRLIDEILPMMKKQKSGKIIQIGSIAGEVPIPFFSHYSATKKAIERYIRALRMELLTSGIQATSILPGYIKTLLHRNVEVPEVDKKADFQDTFYNHVSKFIHKSLKNGMDAPSVAKKIFGISQKKSMGPKYAITAYPENFLTFFNHIIPSVIAEKISIVYFKLGMKSA